MKASLVPKGEEDGSIPTAAAVPKPNTHSLKETTHENQRTISSHRIRTRGALHFHLLFDCATPVPLYQLMEDDEVVNDSSTSDRDANSTDQVAVLDLSHCYFTDRSIENCINQELRANRFLTELDISNARNGWSLGFGRIQQLVAITANALRTNSTLLRLVVDGSEIRCTGAITLAQAIAVNTSLRFLSLRNNGILGKGASAFAEVFQTREVELGLDLRGNAIDDNGADALVSALMGANKPLHCLEVYVTKKFWMGFWFRRMALQLMDYPDLSALSSESEFGDLLSDLPNTASNGVSTSIYPLHGKWQMLSLKIRVVHDTHRAATIHNADDTNN